MERTGTIAPALSIGGYATVRRTEKSIYIHLYQQCVVAADFILYLAHIPDVPILVSHIQQDVGIAFSLSFQRHKTVLLCEMVLRYLTSDFKEEARPHLYSSLPAILISRTSTQIPDSPV